jgi:hypothetical protein
VSPVYKIEGETPAAAPAPPAQKEAAMASTTVTPSASAKESWLGKVWNWISGEVKHVEADVETIFGSDLAQKIEAAGAALLKSNYGPLITAALAEATDVATGQMNIGKAMDTLISMFKAESVSLSKAAALQIIGVAQNSLPALPSTVTPVA